MAKNFIKNIAAVIIMAGAMMASCTKDGRVDEHEQMENDGNIMVSITAKGPQSDSTFTVINKSERFVDNDLEFVVEVKHNGTETYRASAGNALDGVDPQFFHEADTSLVSKPENVQSTIEIVEIPVQREGKPFAAWFIGVEISVSDYMVENKSGLKFNHKLVEKHVVSAKFVYDADIKGTKKAEAVFEVPSREAKEGQQKIEEVMGVVHEGKTYEAFKYGYQRVVNYTIAPEYKIAGESSELTLEATNVAYLLKHEVKTELENLKYIGIFKIEGNELKTDRQEVSFDLVTYDNGEKVERESKHFVLPMELYFRFIKVNDGWFEKEEDLYNEKVEVVPGELTETTGKTDGAYTEKVGRRVYTIKTIDGTYEAVYSYSHWVGHEKIENLYAYLEGMENVLIEAVKNIYESTVAVDVVDAKASVKLNIISPEKKEEAPMETNWKRMRKIPDDIARKYNFVDYIINMERVSANEIRAKENMNILRFIDTNHDVPFDSTDVKYPMVLNDSVEPEVDTMMVKDLDAALKNMKVTSIEDQANKISWSSDKDADGFQKQLTEDGQKIRLSSGHVLNRNYKFEKLFQNGKNVYDYSEVKDAVAGNFSFGKPEIDSVKTEKSISRVAKVMVSFPPIVVSTKGQTKAENNINKFDISVPIYLREVQNDEYIEGGDEYKYWVEIDSDRNLVSCGEHYENYTISGKHLTDSQRYVINPSLKGIDGEAVVAESAEGYEQLDNGHDGTGKGTHTNYAQKGQQKVDFNFTFDAEGNYVMTLKGEKGKGSSHTFKTSFKIEGLGLVSGSVKMDGDYIVNPKISKVKGTYTMDDKSVERYAQSTRNFLVKTADQLIREYPNVVYTKNGNTVDYVGQWVEEWRDKGTIVADEKKGNVSHAFEGIQMENAIVSNFTTVSQKGNSQTGTGKGTFSNSLELNGTDYRQDFNKDVPSTFKVVVKGSNGKEHEIEIPISAEITNTGVTSGSSSISGEYTVYPYASNARCTMNVGTVSVYKDAQSARNFLVKRNVPKIIPEEWGKIIGAGMSAVPAHLVNNQDGFVNGNVADGNGAQTAASCLTIVTENGAVPVIFGWADQEPRVPSTSQILNSTFTEGNYTGYNSGWYNGKVWVPAMAADSGQGIGYSIPSQSNIRFVRNESLVMWGWRSGNYSTKLSGYTTSVNDGTLTVTYNGQIVLEIR